MVFNFATESHENDDKIVNVTSETISDWKNRAMEVGIPMISHRPLM